MQKRKCVLDRFEESINMSLSYLSNIERVIKKCFSIWEKACVFSCDTISRWKYEFDKTLQAGFLPIPLPELPPPVPPVSDESLFEDRLDSLKEVRAETNSNPPPFVPAGKKTTPPFSSSSVHTPAMTLQHSEWEGEKTGESDNLVKSVADYDEKGQSRGARISVTAPQQPGVSQRGGQTSSQLSVTKRKQTTEDFRCKRKRKQNHVDELMSVDEFQPNKFVAMVCVLKIGYFYINLIKLKGLDKGELELDGQNEQHTLEDGISEEKLKHLILNTRNEISQREKVGYFNVHCFIVLCTFVR